MKIQKECIQKSSVILMVLMFILVMSGCESVLYPNGRPGTQKKIVHKPPVDYKKIVVTLLDRYSKNFAEHNEHGLMRIRHYIFTDDAEIIYGNACGPNSFGWCNGGEEIVKAIQTNWNYWDSISFNKKLINVRNFENCILFSTIGNLVVNKNIEEQFKKINDFYFETEKEYSKTKYVRNYDTHIDIVHMLFDFLFDDTNDNSYDVKFVVSGVIEKCGDDWKIAQLHSSYPISFDLGRGDR